MVPQLEMPGADGSTVTARFDGLDGNEIIDRKLDRHMAMKAVRGETSHLLIDRFRFDNFGERNHWRKCDCRSRKRSDERRSG